HVVATTGGIVAPNEVATPPNAVVLNYAAHDPIMRRAALVITHGGHGTAMRALRHGVPMVVIPGLAGDQPFVAAAVQEFGAGLALPGDADAAAMRKAALTVLGDPPTGPKRGAAPKRCHAPTARRAPPARSRRC